MATIRYIFQLSGILTLLFLLPADSFAQKVKVKVDAPKEVWEKEEFRVAYIVEGDKGDISDNISDMLKVDAFKNFDVIYGPSYGYSASTISKEGKSETTYTLKATYVLTAPKKGKYSLPKAEIVIDGKKYKSDIASIEVKSISKTEKENEAFIRTIVSRKAVNLSDTLTLTYRLYTTMDIRQIVRADFPDTNGFYANNMITRSRQTFKTEEYNGKTYNVVDLRKMILQPRSTGVKIIPAGSVTIEFGIPTGKKIKDRWGDTYNEVIRKTEKIPIEEVKVSVQQLIEI